MPGLATHVLANCFVGELIGLRVRNGKYMPIFLLGAVLPDVLTRVPDIVWGKSYWFVVPLHTPLVLILVCYVVSLVFEEAQRKLVFVWLTGGVFLHLFADMLQKHIGTGYCWFFPFSWRSFEVGLFWPSDSVYFMPFLLIMIIMIELYQSLRRRVLAAKYKR